MNNDESETEALLKPFKVYNLGNNSVKDNFITDERTVPYPNNNTRNMDETFNEAKAESSNK